MKSILVLFLGRTGAGSIYTLEMVCSLSKKNKILVILSSYIDNKTDWDKEANFNNNVRIKYVKTYNSIFSFVLSFFNIFRFASLICMINKYNPDMVYSSWVHYWDPIIYPLIKCKNKIKTIHDVVLKAGESNFAFRMLHYFSFKFASKYIVLSKKYIQNCIDKGIDRENIIVIPHAPYTFYKNNHDEPFKFKNKILFFGRIVEYKGLAVLLKAMRVVIKSLPTIKLIIAGDGDISLYREDLHKLENNIEIYNYWISNEEVEKYFNMIDILVLPYIEATQSGVIALSYSFSKPIISTDVGAISEQIHDGETGYVVESNNPVILSDIIIKLMSSPSLVYNMSRKCNEYYLNEMTWDSSAKMILDLL